MQHELGCIISNNDQLSAIIGGTASVASQPQDKEPNILALSSTANTTAWFPLLPIVSVGSGSDSEHLMTKSDISEKVSFFFQNFDIVIFIKPKIEYILKLGS